MTIDCTSRMMSSRLPPLCGSADIDSMNSITGPRSDGCGPVAADGLPDGLPDGLSDGAPDEGTACGRMGRCTLMNSSMGRRECASV